MMNVAKLSGRSFRSVSLFLSMGTVALVVLAGAPCMAYFTVGESGELVKPGQYRAGFEPQIVFTNSGFNFDGFFDVPLTGSSSLRGKMGIGDTSFEGAISYKWIPVPDYDNQPAIGGKIEANFARQAAGNFQALRLMPLISKNFETDWGTMTPYGSIPLNLIAGPVSNITSFELVGGNEWHPVDYRKWMFGAELGINLNNAFTYIAGNVTYFIDDAEVSPKRRGR